MIGILNGVVDAVSNIKVSPLSRAYTFGDAVYEVIPYATGFVEYQSHIKRLLKSCKSLNISISKEIIEQDIALLMEGQDSLKFGYVYYQVTKGVDEERGHIWKGGEAERFGYVKETDLSPKEPKALMLAEDIRWNRCDIKTTGLTANILALESALQKGYDDVLLHKNGWITECSASNIFLVQDSTVLTPTLSYDILEGITRMQVYILCQENNIPIEECNITETDLLVSDAIFQTSSIAGVRKISQVNDTKFSLDNPVVDTIQQLFFKKYLNLVI